MHAGLGRAHGDEQVLRTDLPSLALAARPGRTSRARLRCGPDSDDSHLNRLSQQHLSTGKQIQLGNLEGAFRQGLEAILNGQRDSGASIVDLHGRLGAAAKVLRIRAYIGHLRLPGKRLCAGDLDVENERAAHLDQIPGGNKRACRDVLSRRPRRQGGE